ncbi:DUF6883 domain-containing protein [Thiorhodovibrio winogradskyi]
MKLPNGHRADLGTKLEDYVLNTKHLEGRHKARVFDSALGITLTNVERLRGSLLTAAACSDAAVHRGHNGFGDIYSLRLQMHKGHAYISVQSAWIILNGEDFPRLVSCYVG